MFGDFASTFGRQLPEVSKNAPSWFKSVLHSIVTPAPIFWAVVIEVGELLIGVALIGAALAWGLRFERLSRGGRMVVLGLTAVAAFFGVLLAVSLHLINGGPHPWLIPSDGFNEGVDLDSLLPAMEVVILVVAVRLLQRIRQPRDQDPPASRATPAASPGSG